MRATARISFLVLVLLGVFVFPVMAEQIALEQVNCKFDGATKQFTLTAVVSGNLSEMQNPKLAIAWTRKAVSSRSTDKTDRIIEHGLTRAEGNKLIFEWKANPNLSDVRRGSCFLLYKDKTGKVVQTATKLTDWVAVNQ